MNLSDSYKVSKLYDYINYFFRYPWRNKPNRLYSEWTYGFFGIRLIEFIQTGTITTQTYRWYDYITVITKNQYLTTNELKIYGSASLVLGGIKLVRSLSYAFLQGNEKTYLISYFGFSDRRIRITYETFTYWYETGKEGYNNLAICIEKPSNQIKIYKSANEIDYIPLVAGGTPGDLVNLRIDGCDLYAVTTYLNILNNEQLDYELDLINKCTLKRILQ